MKSVHLIGIGGSGLSAIARFLVEKGYTVSGSDVRINPAIQWLQSAGVRISIGHREENIRGADLIVRSSAIRDDNVEILAAKRADIPIMKRAEFLGQLMEGHYRIAVAGTHGKTTTTAMISWILTDLGQEPSFIIGGVARNLGTSAHVGRGSIFVIEADEYDHMFLGLSPELIVVTNVEHDHPDCFPTAKSFFQAFADFVERLAPGGMLIACGDDEGALSLAHLIKEQNRSTLTYGISSRDGMIDYTAQDVRANEKGGSDFTVVFRGEDLIDISLIIPGMHNVRNALAALVVAHQLQLPLLQAAAALKKYEGTARRFEIRGVRKGVTVIDDYAHHPTEIRATLSAARQRYPSGEIWAVWQPHTFSRTRMFAEGFVKAFDFADHVIITSVYGAREAPDPDFSIDHLLQKMNHLDARHYAEFDQVVDYLNKNVRSGDVILVLSAGDADQISEKMLQEPESDLEVSP